MNLIIFIFFRKISTILIISFIFSSCQIQTNNKEKQETSIQKNTTKIISTDFSESITKENKYICIKNTDCVPIPSCYPEKCINKKFLSNYDYQKPLFCTGKSITTAAYNSNDCICRFTLCVNKKLQDGTNFLEWGKL